MRTETREEKHYVCGTSFPLVLLFVSRALLLTPSLFTRTAPWWSKDTVAVVTGGNKGVGYGIVRKLAEQGLTVVLTAIDSTRGQTTTDASKKDGLQSVFYHPLGVRSSESAEALARWLKEEFGGIDILVNNAGRSNNNATYQDAKDVLDTNYYGVKVVTEPLLPLLRASSAGARIVNVSARAGLYERPKVSSDLMTDLQLLQTKNARESENLEPISSESKVFMNVYALILAKSLARSQPEGHQIFVVGFCPGVTDTDMLSNAKKAGFVQPQGYPLETPAEGADTGVRLALLPKEEIAPKIGKLFGEREEYAFGRVVNF